MVFKYLQCRRMVFDSFGGFEALGSTQSTLWVLGRRISEKGRFRKACFYDVWYATGTTRSRISLVSRSILASKHVYWPRELQDDDVLPEHIQLKIYVKSDAQK